MRTRRPTPTTSDATATCKTCRLRFVLRCAQADHELLGRAKPQAARRGVTRTSRAPRLRSPGQRHQFHPDVRLRRSKFNGLETLRRRVTAAFNRRRLSLKLRVQVSDLFFNCFHSFPARATSCDCSNERPTPRIAVAALLTFVELTAFLPRNAPSNVLPNESAVEASPSALARLRAAPLAPRAARSLSVASFGAHRTQLRCGRIPLLTGNLIQPRPKIPFALVDARNLVVDHGLEQLQFPRTVDGADELLCHIA